MTDLSENAPTSVGGSSSSKAAGVAAAMVTVLIVLGGLGFLAWTFLGGPKQEDLTEVTPTIAQRLAAGMGGRQRAGEFANVNKNGGVAANAGDVHLAAAHPKDKPWRVTVTYNRSDLATPQQSAALTARFRYVADAAYAKSLNVTPDQIKQLNGIEVGTVMPLSEDEKSKLGELCQSLVDAKDKGPAQNALIKQLQTLGPAKLAATKQDVATRAQAVEKILTAEQIKPFLH